MSIRLLICVWIAGIVQAQNPCRVNVIFSLEASTNVNSEDESIVYNQINKVQNAYQSWTISPNSVRATLPKPIGCDQGGNWNLQNDTNSLNNVVSNVKSFLSTCFQPNSLSDYITSLNNQILQSQSVDPANYVFVIFTATTDTNDVQQAINLRKQFFDPKGYGLIVVVVEPQTQQPAANLAQLATYGVYDLGDLIFTQHISSAVCGQISDCSDRTKVNKSGVYQIQPNPLDPNNFVNVYCDVGDNNAYTVVQSRGGSSADDFPTKNTLDGYITPFGTPGVDTNFWLGLDNFYYLTSYNNSYNYSLQIDLCCGANLVASLHYDNFKVSGPSDGYILNATAEVSQLGIDSPGPGGMPDIGSKFSTYDDYQGVYPERICSVYRYTRSDQDANAIGGWWVGSCTNNLNGYYYGVGDPIFYSNNTCQINTDLISNLSVWHGTGIEMRTLGMSQSLDAHSYTRVRMALYRAEYGVPTNTTNFCTATPTSSTPVAQETTTTGSSTTTSTTITGIPVTTSNTNKPRNSTDPVHSSNRTWIIFLCVGIFLFILTVLLLIYCLLRYRAKRRSELIDKLAREMHVQPTIKGKPNEYRKPDDFWIEGNRLEVKHEEPLGTGFSSNVYAGKLIGASFLTSLSVKTTQFKDCKVAIKIANEYGNNESTILEAEIELMKKIGYHEHIISMLGWSIKINKPCLVLELCEGNLLNYVRGNYEIPFKNLISILWQIVQGMEYLASKRLVHRDLAARNILLLEERTAKISDFGLCCTCDDATLSYQASLQKKLPMRWLSIEALLRRTFSEKSDVWSFGILMYEVFSGGKVPYATMEPDDILEFLKCGKRLECPEKANDEVAEIMRSCWEENVETRIYFSELSAKLRLILLSETQDYGYICGEEQKN